MSQTEPEQDYDEPVSGSRTFINGHRIGRDEESSDEEDDKNSKTESPSPAMEIKGIIHGEPDIGKLQSSGSTRSSSGRFSVKYHF